MSRGPLIWLNLRPVRLTPRRLGTTKIGVRRGARASNRGRQDRVNKALTAALIRAIVSALSDAVNCAARTPYIPIPTTRPRFRAAADRGDGVFKEVAEGQISSTMTSGVVAQPALGISQSAFSHTPELWHGGRSMTDGATRSSSPATNSSRPQGL
jgi:hypothetical protein